MSSCAVSIIIVNYNAGNLLSRCMQSIEAQTFRDYEVIIVDNASTDGSLDYAEAFPGIRIVKNERNVGFAVAQNQGMRLAQGQYIMPLNFDIHLEPDFLENMVTALRGSDKIGWVCGKLMQMAPDGTHTNRIYSTGHLLPPNRFPLHRGAGEEDTGQYDHPSEVFGSPGAAPLYKREMLSDIAFRGQYFDESFFMWYEDVDLDWRARWRGWKCIYTPYAVVHHRGHPEGLGRNQKRVAVSILNRWLMVAANECPHCLRRNWTDLGRSEVSLLRYVTLSGLLPAYLSAIRKFAALRPVVIEKRKYILARAGVPCPFQ
ncbi:MAG: glycosyltransferase family 2 protein [Anaerolineales bacterium]|nr:glycosyltransferase family 2 protein [Anaerolineales bacterium]